MQVDDEHVCHGFLTKTLRYANCIAGTSSMSAMKDMHVYKVLSTGCSPVHSLNFCLWYSSATSLGHAECKAVVRNMHKIRDNLPGERSFTIFLSRTGHSRSARRGAACILANSFRNSTASCFGMYCQEHKEWRACAAAMAFVCSGSQGCVIFNAATRRASPPTPVRQNCM